MAHSCSMPHIPHSQYATYCTLMVWHTDIVATYATLTHSMAHKVSSLATLIVWHTHVVCHTHRVCHIWHTDSIAHTAHSQNGTLVHSQYATNGTLIVCHTHSRGTRLDATQLETCGHTHPTPHAYGTQYCISVCTHTLTTPLRENKHEHTWHTIPVCAHVSIRTKKAYRRRGQLGMRMRIASLCLSKQLASKQLASKQLASKQLARKQLPYAYHSIPHAIHTLPPLQ